MKIKFSSVLTLENGKKSAIGEELECSEQYGKYLIKMGLAQNAEITQSDKTNPADSGADKPSGGPRKPKNKPATND